MKINRTIIAAIAAAAAFSCQKEASFESGNLMLEPMTISTEVQTKTSLNGTEIHWTNDDIIAVFDNTGAKNEFTLTMVEGSAADFTGNVTAGTTQIYAVYPYELAKSAEGAVLNVTLPADQTSKAGSFAEEHNISVAKAEKTPGVAQVSGVSFKNACALLKFTVPAYLTDVQKVTVSSNTVMAGDMTIDYSGDTPVCTVSENGSRSISMTGAYEAGSTFWFVLAPVTLDGIKVNVETAKGAWQMSTDSQFEMTAGQYRNLGTLKLEEVLAQGATAAHTYVDGILTGTDVTVSLGIPQNTAAYITSLNLEVKNASGTVVRTLTKNSASATETISADAQWPYLPKGDYSVSGTYTLSGVTEKDIEEISFSVTETPVFEIKSVTAHTSYDKYLAGDAAGANSLDGSTIYGVGADITVSDAILYNSNYNALTVTDNGAAVQTGDLAGRSWGSHTIKASFTLDGVTASSETSVHVTGLPYTLNPVTNDKAYAWVVNENGNVTWNNDGYVRIGYNLSNWLATTSTDITKTFNLPSNINVIVNSTGTACGSGSKTWLGDARINTTFTLSVSGNPVYTYKTTNGGTTQNYSSDDKSATMSSSNPTIKCHNSYSTASGCTRIKTLTVKYGTK